MLKLVAGTLLLCLVWIVVAVGAFGLTCWASLGIVGDPWTVLGLSSIGIWFFCVTVLFGQMEGSAWLRYPGFVLLAFWLAGLMTAGRWLRGFGPPVGPPRTLEMIQLTLSLPLLTWCLTLGPHLVRLYFGVRLSRNATTPEFGAIKLVELIPWTITLLVCLGLLLGSDRRFDVLSQARGDQAVIVLASALSCVVGVLGIMPMVLLLMRFSTATFAYAVVVGLLVSVVAAIWINPPVTNSPVVIWRDWFLLAASVTGPVAVFAFLGALRLLGYRMQIPVRQPKVRRKSGLVNPPHPLD